MSLLHARYPIPIPYIPFPCPFPFRQPIPQDPTTPRQPLLLLRAGPPTSGPPDPPLPIDEKDVPDMLVRHAHRLAEILERLVREEVRRLLRRRDLGAQGGKEHGHEKGLQGVLLEVDLNLRQEAISLALSLPSSSKRVGGRRFLVRRPPATPLGPLT